MILTRKTNSPFIYLIKPHVELHQYNLNQKTQDVTILSKTEIRVLNVNDLICNGTTVMGIEKEGLCKLGTIILNNTEYKIMENKENQMKNFVFNYSKH
ncbi:unnamed protein product [Gordionus sp. m RMFG-2023]